MSSLCDHRWIIKSRGWMCIDCEYEITDDHYKTLLKLSADNEKIAEYRGSLESIRAYDHEGGFCGRTANEALKEGV